MVEKEMKVLYQNESEGFTLIEVMIAVMIISVVIASLLQLFSTNTRLFSTLEQKIELSTEGSLLLGVENIGFENKSLHFDDLVKEFVIDDELRRRLKEIKAEVVYQELMRLDSADFMEEAEELADEKEIPIADVGDKSVGLEIGRTGLLFNNVKTSFIRLRLQ